MGTVHGVYLKYVGLSALSYAGFSYLARTEGGERLSMSQLLGHTSRSLLALSLGYSAALNGVIAVLFKLEIGMELLGKNRKTGQIPTWSYIVFFPFHFPSIIYTYIHTLTGTHTITKEDGEQITEVVPVASEVQPNWWIGGCHAHELDKDWAGVIDLTTEFPETTIDRTRAYLCMPTWDGVPATPDQIEEAANFALTASQQGGDVLVHCAHGRGRSTTIMCACLVKAGLFTTWEDAFEKGIKPKRPCCKLNKRMMENLTKWQATYVESREKKEQ